MTRRMFWIIGWIVVAILVVSLFLVFWNTFA